MSDVNMYFGETVFLLFFKSYNRFDCKSSLIYLYYSMSTGHYIYYIYIYFYLLNEPEFFC